jgi:hypothetical protein
MKSIALNIFSLAVSVAIVGECAPALGVSANGVLSWDEDPNYQRPEPIGTALIESVRILTPTLNKDAIHKQIRYGPYVIPGANEPTVGIPEDPKDIKGAFSFTTNVAPMCTDCMVLRGGAVLEYANGTKASIADGIYNHHVVTNNYGKKERGVTCPGSIAIPKTAGLFIGGGNEHGDLLYTSEDGNFKSGYYIKPIDTFDMEGEFMNYNTAPQTIYVVLDFEYLPGKPEGYLDAHSLTLSVAPCNETAFKLQCPD